MPGKLSDTATVVEVPAADRRIRGAGKDKISSTDESVNALLVTREDSQTDAGCHVPLAHRFVDASADDEDLLDNDAGDVVLVASQDADTVAPRSLGRPNSDGVVVRSCDQNGAVFAHSHAVDGT